MIRGARAVSDEAPVPVGMAALRAEARSRRAALAPAVRAAAEASAQRHVLDLLAPLPPGAAVALYAAIRGEVATDAIAAGARARGLDVLYPRIGLADRQLHFHRVREEALVCGKFRIPEPPAGAPEVEAAALAAVIVPALLFDRQGHRLGWGGGYYDTTLPRAAAALRIGLGFELQLVDRLPIEPHDCPVHLIATEVAVYPGAPRGAAVRGTTT